MERSMTLILTACALTLAIPASASECVPNLTRAADVDTGGELHAATGGHDCTAGLGQPGCEASRELRGQPPGAAGGGLRVYVDSDDCQRIPAQDNSCLFSVWAYFETNGIDGLQRQDGGINDDLSRGVDDTCGGQVASDQQFF